MKEVSKFAGLVLSLQISGTGFLQTKGSELPEP